MSDACIAADSDVSGIGIRLNFYLTVWLMAIIPNTPWTEELLGTLYNNAGIAGLGLLVTAIVRTAQNRLDLYHALFILHILYFFGVSASPAGKYRWNYGRTLILIALQVLAIITTLGWSLYIWVHVRSFGPSPECNHLIKYVFFFANVHPTTNWFRHFIMAILIISAVGATIGIILAGVTLVVSGRSRIRDGLAAVNEGVEARHTAGSRGFYISWRAVPAAIYSTIMLELTVKRNKHLLKDGENEWAFGQILSLIMIISTVNEILRCIYVWTTRAKR